MKAVCQIVKRTNVDLIGFQIVPIIALRFEA
jgi:hypothetical protein